MIEKKRKRFFWLLAFLIIGGGIYTLLNGRAGFVGAYNIQLDFEKYIPFMPWTIFIYYLIAPYFVSIFFIEKHKDFLKVILGLWIIVVVSIFIFYIFPTTMPRPKITEKGIIWTLFNALHYADGPNNLFPSGHVSLTSYIAYVIWHLRSRFIGVLSGITAIAICLSTLTVKQHAVLDVLGGAVVGFIAFLIVFKVIFYKRA